MHTPRYAQLIEVHDGKLKGLWTSLPFDGPRPPRQVVIALEQLAGRAANAYHAGADPDSPSPVVSASAPLRHSPSPEHWNQLILLVIAGHAEMLG